MNNGKYVVDYIFNDYRPTLGHISVVDFEEHPATALLRFTIDVKNAVEKCKTEFPKLANNHLTLESKVAIQNIINSSLAAIMGYFEMYEKYLFAGVFEQSSLLKKFDEKAFFKATFGPCEKGKVEIPIEQLTAYRRSSVSTGLIIANSLSGWHSPQKVNSYFMAFGLRTNVFSNADVDELNLLWQMRHSIVHNAASITLADAQKLPALKKLGNKEIVLSNKFIYDLTKYLHSVVFNANTRVKTEFSNGLIHELSATEKQNALKIFEVTSSVPAWLH